MAAIQLKRKKEFQSSIRNYQVFVDNKKIGTILPGYDKEDYSYSVCTRIYEFY